MSMLWVDGYGFFVHSRLADDGGSLALPGLRFAIQASRIDNLISQIA